MLELSFRYSFFIFAAVVGVLQAAGTHNGSLGLAFFKNKVPAYIFALAATGGSLAVFFAWNYWYDTSVIEGSQQFGLFVISTILALIFTMLISSFVTQKPFHFRDYTVAAFISVKQWVISWRSRKRKEKYIV